MIPLLPGNYLLASRGLRLIAGRDDGLENFIWRGEKIRKKGRHLLLSAGWEGFLLVGRLKGSNYP